MLPRVKSAMLPTTGSSARLSGLGDSQSILRQRRTTIPARPNYSLNLWSIMKNFIGKDLSRIPMPVSFLCQDLSSLHLNTYANDVVHVGVIVT